MPGICVLYLVRAINGPEPVTQFFRSYSRFRAGPEHDLALIFKGFARESDTVQYRELAGSACSRVFHVDDSGFDIKAYGTAARQLPHEHFCFLNSFSEILAENWLGNLIAAARERGVGLAGATGSGES